MRIESSLRIVRSSLLDRSLKENYWSLCRSGHQFARLLDPVNRSFATVVLKAIVQFVFGLEAEDGDLPRRMRSAVDWLLRAQERTGSPGVALGYFPCDGKSPWHSAYPETTGYIITSLLRYANRYGDATVRQRALEMAQWEIEI